MRPAMRPTHPGGEVFQKAGEQVSTKLSCRCAFFGFAPLPCLASVSVNDASLAIESVAQNEATENHVSESGRGREDGEDTSYRGTTRG